MKVEFHPSTVSDVNEAASFFQRVRAGLESEFRHEIDATIDRIANTPLLFPIVEAQTRRCIVRRFPFSILLANDVWRNLDATYRHAYLANNGGASRQFDISSKGAEAAIRLLADK